jgi:hypothetical protein
LPHLYRHVIHHGALLVFFHQVLGPQDHALQLV